MGSLARRGGRSGGVIAACVVALGWASPRLAAKEIGRTAGRTERPARWTEPLVTLRFAARGLEPPARSAAAQAAAAMAAAAWSSARSVAGVRIAEADPARLGAERDGVNTVSFLQQQWCRAGRWRNGCYPSSELAVTTVYLSPEPGPGGEAVIAEVDIEINAVDYDWFGDSPGKRVPPTDLAGLLSHEFGHAFGLLHARPSRRGQASGTATIMTEAAHEGRDRQRRPSPFDKRALCVLYPTAERPGGRDPNLARR